MQKIKDCVGSKNWLLAKFALAENENTYISIAWFPCMQSVRHRCGVCTWVPNFRHDSIILPGIVTI